MRIGIFIDSYFPYVDGVVMVVHNYAKRLSEKHEVTVVTTSDKTYKDDFPYEVIRVKSLKLPKKIGGFSVAIPQLDMKIKNKLLQKNFDIIHIHSPFTIGKLGILIANKQHIPTVGTMHTQFHLEFMRYTKSEIMTKYLLKEILKVFHQCNECWAVNENLADVFLNYGYKGKLKTISNGTDLKLIEDKNGKKEIEKIYNIRSNEKLLLFVGRINILKNITFIVEVIYQLKKEKVKLKMLFVGTGPDEEILKKKIKDFDLGKEIILAGKIEDRALLAKIYNRADLFIFPSLFDASSLVQVEAASQKTPTIFIENTVTSGTITPNKNGFVAPNDPELFALTIKNIFKNKKLYEEVSKGAYNEIYKNWDNLTDEVIERYENLIKDRKQQ